MFLKRLSKKYYIRKLSERARILSVKLIDLKDHVEEIGAFSFGALPDVFISLSTFSLSTECFWREQSSVKSLSLPVWDNEKHFACVPSPSSLLVLNVMSRSAILGDAFIGQVVIDVDILLNGVPLGEDVSISSYLSGTVHTPLCDSKGQICPQQPMQIPTTGTLSISISSLSYFDNMCGWFREATMNIFRVVETKRIWVIATKTEDSILYSVYDSKYVGETRLLRSFESKNIQNFEKVQNGNYNSSFVAAGNTDGYIQFKLRPSGESISWAWDVDTGNCKGLWCRIFKLGSIVTEAVVSSER